MKATDYDLRIIDATSVALDGRIGEPDDVQRLRDKIVSDDHERTLAEIAVAFIRWAQDLKAK